MKREIFVQKRQNFEQKNSIKQNEIVVYVKIVDRSTSDGTMVFFLGYGRDHRFEHHI